METKLKRPLEGADHQIPTKKLKIENKCRMADWNILPTELLIQILAELDYNSRLNCKIVCQRWLEVLMTDFQFTDDRTLDLRDCSIAQFFPPYNVLKNAAYNYNCLVLNEESVNFEDFEDVREFWELIGKSVTKVKYEGNWNSKLVIVLATFEKMKSFETLEKDLIHGMSQLSTNFLSRAFGNVEILSIDGLKTDVSEIFPKLKMVNCRKGSLKYKVRVKDGRKSSFVDASTKCIDTESIEFEEIEHELQPEESFNALLDFLKQNKSIKKTHLTLNHIPKDPIPEIIDSLTLDKMDVSVLNHLRPNLIKRLKSLSLKNIHMRSLDCLSSATIFPNVDYLNIKLDRHPTNHCLTTPEEGCTTNKFSISHKFPNLKVLKTDLMALRRFSDDNPMQHVQKLIIKGEARMISNFDWKKILPSLTYLSIKLVSPYKETQQTISDIVADLKDVLPDLSYLRIIPEKPEEDTEEEFELAKFKVLNTAQRLKTLVIDYDFDSCSNMKTLATNLLNESSTLNVVKLGSNGNFCCFYRRNILDDNSPAVV